MGISNDISSAFSATKEEYTLIEEDNTFNPEEVVLEETETDVSGEQAKAETGGEAAQDPDTAAADDGEYRYIMHLTRNDGTVIDEKPVRLKDLEYAADLLERTAEIVKGKGTLNFIFVPQSYLSNKYFLNVDEYKSWTDEATAYLDTLCGDDVHVYSFADHIEEPARNGEYLAYKTDCHWTIIGNWYVYEAVMKDMGIEPVALTDYTMDEYSGFNGSYATARGATGPGPDTLLLPRLLVNTTYYRYFRSFEDVSESPIYDFSAGINYYAFLGSRQGLWTVLQTDAGTGRNCLVIKDSYGPSFALLLTPHYDNVHLLDMRSFPSVDNKTGLAEVCRRWDIDDIYVVLSDINGYGKTYMNTYWESMMK